MQRAAIDGFGMKSEASPLGQEAQEMEVCSRIETEIRRHTRLIASYGYATSEGLDDLREGLSSLINICESRQAAERDAELIGWIRNLRNLADSIKTDISACTDTSDQLCARIIEQMRQSPIGNRRSEFRMPIELPCVLHHRSESLAAKTLDISNSGAKIQLQQIGRCAIVKFDQLQLNIESIGVLEASIVRIEGNIIHILFTKNSEIVTQNLDSLINKLPKFVENVLLEIECQNFRAEGCSGADQKFLKVKEKLPELTAAKVFLQHESGLKVLELNAKAKSFEWPQEMAGRIFSLGSERECSILCKDGQMVVSISNRSNSISVLQLAVDSCAFALSGKADQGRGAAVALEC